MEYFTLVGLTVIGKKITQSCPKHTTMRIMFFGNLNFAAVQQINFLGNRSGPGEILYNAIDTEFFHPSKQKYPNKPLTFLITGKIGQHLNYRLESTIKALAEARNNGLNAELLISGWIETPQLIKEFAKFELG